MHRREWIAYSFALGMLAILITFIWISTGSVREATADVSSPGGPETDRSSASTIEAISGDLSEVAVPIDMPPNERPIVNAGADQAFLISETVRLEGVVTDDGYPVNPGRLFVEWRVVSGPDTVMFLDATSAATSATFSSVGEYVLRLTASDGELTSADDVHIKIADDRVDVSIEVRVASSEDDAEEKPSGSMDLTSSDLELVQARTLQTVGMRFVGVGIPPGTTIEEAYVQFQVDETSSDETLLSIQGEAVDHSAVFSLEDGNITSRPRTTAAVTWSPNPWLTVQEADADQRTPNLAAVVQEIVDRPGWEAGNALTIIITGNGARIAESFDGDQDGAPQLVVTYKDHTGVALPAEPGPLTPDTSTVRFAVIGDFGSGNTHEARVAALVDSWQPDFVVTTGDNNYPDGEAATIDDHIGKFYRHYIGDYQGAYGAGSADNRFWPSLGNHDWRTIDCSGGSCSGAYFDYFTLPNNERYYETDLGLVHLFVIDSDANEPDGRDVNSIQASWLQTQLAASTSCFNLVVFHHPPYSSGRHGSVGAMQWPFAAWGADAVLNGHDHLYERIEANGIPYFVNGAGGASLYNFDNLGTLPPEATSVVRYNQDRGAMLVTATPTQINYQFYSADGLLIDDYTVPKDCGIPDPAPNVINVPGDASTIQDGIDMAADGDTVLVAPGTYFENLVIASKTITLTSRFHMTGDASYINDTIIDGGSITATIITVESSVGPETTISGFTIQNGDDGISAKAKLNIHNNFFTGTKDAIDYESGGGICRYNLFENNVDDAIDLDGASEVTIEYNVLNNSGDDGIEIRLHPYTGPQLDIIIRWNVISGSDEDGIQLIGYDVPTDRFFLIERNLIEGSAMVGVGLMDNQETGEDFRGASLPERIHLFNNTFVDNDHALTGGDNLIALNNIFAGATTMALKNVDGSSIAAYNLFWQNGIDFQNSSVDVGTTVLADPLFGANYILQDGSPAIDAGTASFTWKTELILDLQTEEYVGSAPDLGAYEKNAELFLPGVIN